MKTIKWKSKIVEVSKVKPTPNNYKIRTDLGLERLRYSLKTYGLAGTVIVNTDLTLIDGNSRWEEAKAKKEKYIEVSMPDRALTKKEFTEMSAIYDFAKAGEVDLERIKGDLGTTEDFYKKLHLEVPLAMLAKIGTGGKAITAGAMTSGEVKKLQEVGATSDIRMVQLFFTAKQEAEFRAMEAKLAKRFKSDNTTDTVFKAIKSIK